MKTAFPLPEKAKEAMKIWKEDNYLYICQKCYFPCSIESGPYPYDYEGNFSTYSSCCGVDYEYSLKEYSPRHSDLEMECGRCRNVCRIVQLKGMLDYTECCGCERFRFLSRKDEKVV